MSENENFKEGLDTWLKETCDTCHEYALEIDTDFYIFQTPLPTEKKLDLLVVGINPGGYKSYQKALQEKAKDEGREYTKRTKESLYYDVNTLTRKPQWEKLKGNDKMRTNLRRVFTSDRLFSLLDGAVMMNMYYFNTLKEKDLASVVGKNAQDFCKQQTSKFIELVEPKNILFFTTSEHNLSRMGVSKIEGLGFGLKKGILGGREILALSHPTGYWRAYSYANGEKLAYLLEQHLR